MCSRNGIRTPTGRTKGHTRNCNLLLPSAANLSFEETARPFLPRLAIEARSCRASDLGINSGPVQRELDDEERFLKAEMQNGPEGEEDKEVKRKPEPREIEATPSQQETEYASIVEDLSRAGPPLGASVGEEELLQTFGSPGRHGNVSLCSLVGGTKSTSVDTDPAEDAVLRACERALGVAGREPERMKRLRLILGGVERTVDALRKAEAENEAKGKIILSLGDSMKRADKLYEKMKRKCERERERRKVACGIVKGVSAAVLSGGKSESVLEQCRELVKRYHHHAEPGRKENSPLEDNRAAGPNNAVTHPEHERFRAEVARLQKGADECQTAISDLMLLFHVQSREELVVSLRKVEQVARRLPRLENFITEVGRTLSQLYSKSDTCEAALQCVQSLVARTKENLWLRAQIKLVLGLHTTDSAEILASLRGIVRRANGEDSVFRLGDNSECRYKTCGCNG